MSDYNLKNYFSTMIEDYDCYKDVKETLIKSFDKIEESIVYIMNTELEWEYEEIQSFIDKRFEMRKKVLNLFFKEFIENLIKEYGYCSCEEVAKVIIVAKNKDEIKFPIVSDYNFRYKDFFPLHALCDNFMFLNDFNKHPSDLSINPELMNIAYIEITMKDKKIIKKILNNCNELGTEKEFIENTQSLENLVVEYDYKIGIDNSNLYILATYTYNNGIKWHN